MERRLSAPGAGAFLLALVMAIAFAAELGFAAARPFWYDELLTLHVASLDGLSAIRAALSDGVDGMPLAFNLLMASSGRLPLDPHLAFRLPSILGYLLALAGVYAFVAKRGGAALGLAAALLLALSPFEAFAIEARPYALVAGCLAIAAALWQRSGERPWLAAPLCLALGLASTFHYLSVAALGCFAAAEIADNATRRRLRPHVWAAIVLAAVPALQALPALARYREAFGEYFWSKPTPAVLFATFTELNALPVRYFLVFALCAGLVAAAAPFARRAAAERAGAREGFTVPEITLGAGLLVYPVLLVILATLTGSGYVPRYAVPHVIGFVLVAAFLWRSRLARADAGWLLAALLLVFVASDGRAALRGAARGPSAAAEFRAAFARRLASADDAAARHGLPADAPVVIASATEYLPAAYYLDPRTAARCRYLASAADAARLTGADTADRTMEAVGRRFPRATRVETPSPFLTTHPRFIVFSGNDPGTSWLPRLLIERGVRLTLLLDDGRGEVYLADVR